MSARPTPTIVGIDPGLANCGFGVVSLEGSSHELVESGTILTPAGADLGDRLQSIADRVGGLLALYHPVELAMESLFFGDNVTSAIVVAQALGVVRLEAARAGVPVSEYRPQQVKSAVCGVSKASKEQVHRMVVALTGARDQQMSSHAADATAAAICGWNHRGMRRALDATS